MTEPPSRQRRRGDVAQEREPLLPGAAADRPAPRDPRSFLAILETALAGARRSRRPLALCLIDTEHPMSALVVARRTVRTTDGVWRIGPTRVAVVFVDAGGPASEPAFTRLSAALADGLSVPARIGWASAPIGIGAATLVDLAEAGLVECH